MPLKNQHWSPHFLLGHPLFESFEALSHRFRGAAWPLRAAFTEASDCPASETPRFEFIPQHSKAEGPEASYDGTIATSRRVQCLETSWHDFFNALVFMRFPRAKYALHHRQFCEVRANCVGSPRSRVQDALTNFDERGAVIEVTDSVREKWEGLRQPTRSSALGQGVRVHLFGHGALEALHAGHSSLRLHGVVVQASPSVDAALAERVSNEDDFQEPGSDCILHWSTEGGVRLGPLKGWTERLGSFA